MQRLRTDADAATGRGPYSVVDKAAPAASGDPHDYLSLAPYWWPDPDAPDGLPHIRRDGLFFPPATIGGDGSEAYDRTRLFACFDDITICALAWSRGAR